LDCRCYDSIGKPLEAAAGKPAESKKSYKKFESNKSMAFMQTMFEAYVKTKKAGKLKKHKKRDYDSSDSSGSEYETGSGDTVFSVDRHLKTDNLLGTVYLSTESRPIKVADTAPTNNMRADEIAIETAKIGKVTAVVVVMSIFCKKKYKSWSANPKNKKPSCQKPESVIFSEENFRGPRNLSQKTRKGQLPKKIVPKSKKLELNGTNLKQKSRKHT
jgi:hypothetical protein